MRPGLFVILIFILACQTPAPESEIETKPIDIVTVSTIPDTTPVKQVFLGKTGYSILLPETYELQMLNDSAFFFEKITQEQGLTSGRVSIEFTAGKLKVKVGHRKENLVDFTDSIAGKPVSTSRYIAHGSAHIEGSIPDGDRFIDFECSAKATDKTMENKELQYLYTIVRTLSK